MARADTIHVHLPVVAAAGTDLKVVASLPGISGEYKLQSANLSAAATSTAHATNVAIITLYGSDADGAAGGTAQGSWDTTTGQDGTLTAGDVQVLTLAGGATSVFEAGELIEVHVDESGGTGVAINGSIDLEFVKLR